MGHARGQLNAPNIFGRCINGLRPDTQKLGFFRRNRESPRKRRINQRGRRFVVVQSALPHVHACVFCVHGSWTIFGAFFFRLFFFLNFAGSNDYSVWPNVNARASAWNLLCLGAIFCCCWCWLALGRLVMWLIAKVACGVVLLGMCLRSCVLNSGCLVCNRRLRR